MIACYQWINNINSCIRSSDTVESDIQVMRI